MAQDLFTGAASTALATHDANWKACTAQDGLTTLSLDGSGNLQQTSTFNFCDAYYDDGTTGANSKSHVTFPAGIGMDGVNLMGAAVRRTASQVGYVAILKSSTNVPTNFDQISIRKNTTAIDTFSLNTPINASTTQVDLTIQLVNTVDLAVTVNGTIYTRAGSGGNDIGGAAVLTGGFPGVSNYRNGGATSLFVMTAWTDDAAGIVAANDGRAAQLGPGIGPRSVLQFRSFPYSRDTVQQAVAPVAGTWSCIPGPGPGVGPFSNLQFTSFSYSTFIAPTPPINPVVGSIGYITPPGPGVGPMARRQFFQPVRGLDIPGPVSSGIVLMGGTFDLLTPMPGLMQ